MNLGHQSAGFTLSVDYVVQQAFEHEQAVARGATATGLKADPLRADALWKKGHAWHHPGSRPEARAVAG
jgi:hypothetical protein